MVEKIKQKTQRGQFTQLDEKLYELQTLFDLSKTLNSSIKNLRTVLDTLLLTPMGKLLITKGVVLLRKSNHAFVIETLKGLSRALQGQSILIEDCPQEPVFVADLDPTPWRAFFHKYEIELLIPLYHDDRELGLLGFGKKTIGQSYSAQELDYLFSLSNIAATAVQNGLIFKEKNEVNRQLEKKVQEQNTIFEISQEVNSPPLEIDKVQNLLAYAIMGEMMVKGVLIYLVKDGTLNLTLNKGFPGVASCEVLTQEKFKTSLLALEAPLMVNDEDDYLFCPQLQEIAVSVLIPLRIQDETKGVIALGEKITKDNFTRDELEFLRTLGNLSINSIENARLFEEEKEKQRLEEELSIARDIQKRLLPDACPTLENFEVSAINHSSLQVGGDYYDCIKLDEEHYVFCIADVSGKGAPAALLMSNLQAGLHALLGTDVGLTEIVYRINNLIYRNTTFDKFITFFFGVLDLQKNTFTSVNAGHNPPYLYHADATFTTFNEGGLILGMMPNVKYDSETVTLQSGDLLVMFTDGVSEAMNGDDEEFEEKRIEECVAKNLKNPTHDILRNLLDAVNDFAQGQPQADDITILMVKAK